MAPVTNSRPGNRQPTVFDQRNKRVYTHGQPTLRVVPKGNLYFSKLAVRLLQLEFPARIRVLCLPDPMAPHRTNWYFVSCPSTDKDAMPIKKKKRDGGCDLALVAMAKALFEGSPLPEGAVSAQWKFYPRPVEIDVPGMPGKQRACQLIYPEQFRPQDKL